MSKEDFEKLASLWEMSSKGKVTQIVGRSFPKRIDLMTGENLPKDLQELERRRNEFIGKCQQICHLHPTTEIWRELNPNAEHDMNLIEALWNMAPDLIALAKATLKEDSNG